ncbi:MULTISPECIES: phage tail tape measure protein [unclassified Agrobacterium]|uniref:phage tail tape measure protein n=1 Tax=unclassified Agrobacterium TaxID=2632611 RepID=UPI002447BE83|nr:MULTISPECIES: phage tail tape measure protein [unclassified Agrobacterium]MDH0613429.1 phage tail tape measure protein [Agrobacterium sp. GD03872]MDH0697346.1 phage tail tape measure protein [Agrobacterium sp. GD03871]MDH1060869.1 phage tail tape measure protein [Agrobacterium sp. GD03992]MDH2211453.1 phage tail tape measure protein [Agrobacterium sp. GD03643]MDH2220712.1 phage tail tape measure protein [Agrobacterium sp. GD03638]
MTTRVAKLRLQLIDAVSGPSHNAANSLRGIDGALSRFGKGGTPEIKRMVKQLEHLQKKAGSIEDFTAQRRGFKDLATQMGAARSNLSKLEQSLRGVARPTEKMKAELKTAELQVEATTRAFREQGAAVRVSERMLQAYGIAGRKNISGAQQAIRNEIAKTIREMRRLDTEARRPKPPRQPPSRQPPGPRPPGGGSGAYEAVVAAGGAYAAYGVRNVAGKSLMSAVNFNEAAAFQAAIGGFEGEDRKALNRQAEKIGGDTRFDNVDVIRAQTTILQGGIRDAKTIMDLTDKVTDYALAMGVTLDEAAETVRGSALSKRIKLSDANAIGKFVDQLVWMAKNGGMNDEDVRQFQKYGGASTIGAGLSDDYAATIAMVLKRAGVRGDEAGVFARAASSKLVAPTKKGRDALAAMGIDFNKFTSIDAMNTDGIGIMMRNNFGARLTQEMKDSVKELIDNGEFTDPETGENRSVISDSGEFVSQMSNILAPLFQDKKGKMSAQDAKALAKALADYQKYSIDSVNSVGLFEAIMSSNPGLGNLNAFFTDKQGGRANMIAQQWPLFQELLNTFRNTPNGVAKDIGTKANAELYGDWTKMVGTFETVVTRIGQDFEGVTRPVINHLNSVGDGFLQLDQATRQAVAGVAGLAGALMGFAALRAGTSFVGRMLGGGAAAGTAARFAGGGGSMAFGGAARLLGPLGAAYTGYELGKAARGVGAIAGGRHWMPKDQDDAADLRAQADEKRRKIAEIRANSRIPEMANTLIQPLQQDLDMLENRIRAFDQLQVKPQIDSSSIDAAQAKANLLKDTLARWGTVPTSPGSAPSAGPTPPVSGARRRGGPVEAGKTYRVGEDGEERFTPGADGFITPNHALGGGGGIVLHAPISLTFHGSSAADVKRVAKEAAQEAVVTLTRGLNQKLSRSRDTLVGGIKDYDL